MERRRSKRTAASLCPALLYSWICVPFLQWHAIQPVSKQSVHRYHDTQSLCECKRTLVMRQFQICGSHSASMAIASIECISFFLFGITLFLLLHFTLVFLFLTICLDSDLAFLCRFPQNRFCFSFRENRKRRNKQTYATENISHLWDKCFSKNTPAIRCVLFWT